MDSAGIKYADLKKEERYKRLESNLKLAFVKQMERLKTSDKKGYYYTSPSWPSLSSINPDGTDMSCINGSPSLQVSRVESEVLSSSKNLRKVLTVHQNGHIEQRLPMATSSVKKFPINNCEEDRVMMPPPPSALFHNTKKMSSIDSKQIRQSQQECGKELEDKIPDSLVKQSSGASSYHESNISQADFDALQPRVFYQWRVLLNDQGQLIIKGTLECGKIARSKPVIQRFASNKVLSIYKHIYMLHGNIVDIRNELPEYVRGKFHNGFPDDWENVYQLWRNYIAGGCQSTFRWPTPITDSDDDLQSEITDFSYFKNKQIEYKNQELHSKSISDNGSLGYHSKLQTNSNQNLEKSNEDNTEIKSTSKNHVMNKKIDDSGHSSEVKDTSQCNHEHSTESLSKETHCTGANNSSSNLKNISFLYETIREDKVRIILSKLGDTNCPAQYLDKFIDLIDCLKYLLIHNSNTNNENDNLEQNSSSKIQNQSCSKCNTASFSETQETAAGNQLNTCNNDPNDPNSAITEETHKNTIQESRVHKNVKADSTNESSDSDEYMGFPNVSLGHLIKPKMTKCERYRNRKGCSNDNKNINKNIPDKEKIHSIPNEQHYDSSVSISEDDFERRILEQKKAVAPFSPHKDRNKITTIANLKHENVKKGNSNNDVDKGFDDDGFKVPSITSRMNQKSGEKKKPIIKSCEPANFDVKLRYKQRDQVSVNSDISIVEENVTSKNNSTPLENYKPVSTIHRGDETDDKHKELIQHPFLTYDSEDFLNDEEINLQDQIIPYNSDKLQVTSPQHEKNNKIDGIKTPETVAVTKGHTGDKSSSGNKKTPLNTRSAKKDLFGSKENPKVLASWIPVVMYDDEFKKKCSLTFEGKLLNEAGHILHRKFITDPVYQRHSTTVIETVNGEFYKLSGELNDTKHVLPKELLKHCRTGCPSKIKEFCEEWKRLRPVLEKNGTEKFSGMHDVSIDTFNIQTSSRGRRIVPRLEYWNGERIVIRDNDTIYTPGLEYDTASLQNSKHIETFQKPTALSEQRPPKNSVKKEVLKRVSKTSKKPSTTENKSNQRTKENSANKRVAQILQYSSSSDSDQKVSPNKKTLRSSRQKTKNKPDAQPKNITPQLKIDILTESAYNTKQPKRQRLESKGNQQPKMKSTRRAQTAIKKPDAKLVWTYEREQRHRDILSDDQASIRYC